VLRANRQRKSSFDARSRCDDPTPLRSIQSLLYLDLEQCDRSAAAAVAELP
jgi:hypothetical protein